MEMKVAGEGAIAASPEKIWSVIFDPAFMSQVIPGCKAIEQPAENEYRIKMVLGIPAIQGQYSGTLKILAKSPCDAIKGSIEGKGGLGKIDGTWHMQFKPHNEKESSVNYDIAVDIGGPMASMVGGFMEQVADSLIRQGLESFSTAIAEIAADTPFQKPRQTNVLTRPGIVKMIFRSIWDIISSKIKTR